MPVSEEDLYKVRAIVQNILDVFGGADGGVAFATMFHSHLPELIKSDSAAAADLMRSFTHINNYCGHLLKRNRASAGSGIAEWRGRGDRRQNHARVQRTGGSFQGHGLMVNGH